MKTRLSRLFLAGGQNAVPISGWFFSGWTPATTLAIFWFENLVLGLVIAARIAAHWSATRTGGLTDLWSIGRWPFAEIRRRTDWMLGRVVMVHLSILFGMFLFVWLDRPWWFFSVFVSFKAMLDVGGLLPRWNPKEPPAWFAKGANRMDMKTGTRGRKQETFEEYWARTNREEASQRARDEEVVGA